MSENERVNGDINEDINEGTNEGASESTTTQNTTSSGFNFNKVIGQATENLNVCMQLIKQRQQAFDTIYSKNEFDVVQIGMVTLIAIIASLITGKGFGSFGLIIGYPIGIFIGAGILALLVLIGKGKVEYMKLVNIVAYTYTFTAVATIFELLPIVGGLIVLAAGIYAMVLNILAIVEKAGADQKRVLIAVAILIGIIVIAMIIIVAVASIAFASTGILDWIY